jgi:hypothetical protein
VTSCTARTAPKDFETESTTRAGAPALPSVMRRLYGAVSGDGRGRGSAAHRASKHLVAVVLELRRADARDLRELLARRMASHGSCGSHSSLRGSQEAADSPFVTLGSQRTLVILAGQRDQLRTGHCRRQLTRPLQHLVLEPDDNQRSGGF